MVPDVALKLLGGGFVLALALVALVLAAAQRLTLYAHPNVRSFHDQPKPTAGGIAFVVPVVAWLGWVAAAEPGAATEPGAAAVLGLGCAAVAAVGLWDDVSELSRLVRFLVHAAIAAAFVTSSLDLSWWLAVAAAAALVWQINLYNFMDGIDGIASVQALLYLVGAQVVAQGIPGWSGDVAWLACGAVLGFLVFNFPPSRLFMGDVGSGFLGLLTGALALLWWRQGALHPVAALILLAGFWLDASYTLIIRIFTGQPFTQAHRSHLYQKVATRRGHAWTTVGYLSYGVFWLLPLAWLSVRFPAEPALTTWLWLLPAVTPVLIAAWWLRAGLSAHEPENELRPR